MRLNLPIQFPSGFPHSFLKGPISCQKSWDTGEGGCSDNPHFTGEGFKSFCRQRDFKCVSCLRKESPCLAHILCRVRSCLLLFFAFHHGSTWQWPTQTTCPITWASSAPSVQGPLGIWQRLKLSKSSACCKQTSVPLGYFWEEGTASWQSVPSSLLSVFFFFTSSIWKSLRSWLTCTGLVFKIYKN